MSLIMSKSNLFIRIILFFTLPISKDVFAAMHDDDIEFDGQSLKIHNIDPVISRSFRHASRFLPGVNIIELKVNDRYHGKVSLYFNDNGQFCADEIFYQKTNLLPYSEFKNEEGCFNIKKHWPQAEIILEPEASRVSLIVPPQAISSSGNNKGEWEYGGTAGLLNYDLQYVKSSNLNYSQVVTEAGVNVKNWVVRSKQIVSNLNGTILKKHQAAYVQHSFINSKKTFQVGQITLSNSLFGAGQVLGFQFFPESALLGTRGGPGLVEGIADTISVIEIHQSGALLYRTTVPVGPYRIQNFPLLNNRSDLSVSQINSSGENRQFTIPASALLHDGSAENPGFSFGVGKLELQDIESSLISSAASGWLITPYTTLYSGALFSNEYHSGAVKVESQLFDNIISSFQSTVSRDTIQNNKGALFHANINHLLNDKISANINYTWRGLGYREFGDTMWKNGLYTQKRIHKQYGLGGVIATDKAGNISLSMASSNSILSGDLLYVRASWGGNIGRIYSSINVEHNGESPFMNGGSRLYATISIPFAKGQDIGNYYNSNGKYSRGGIRYSNRENPDRGWSISTERNFRSGFNTTTSTLDITTQHSQFGGSIMHDSTTNMALSTHLTGSVVVHRNGFTLSPYPVDDTFGIAKVGNEGGVRLDTPSGSTWTNKGGYAVLPSLGKFSSSTVQVDTRSLSKSIDIGNAWQETNTARGSVSFLDFDVTQTRRVLAYVEDLQGDKLQPGSAVFDSSGNFVTFVGEDGSIFVPNAFDTPKLDVKRPGKSVCSFEISLPINKKGNRLYETTKSVCN